MKYLAYDGKVFDNQDQCKEYEHRLHEKDDEKEMDYEELLTLRDEYKAAQKRFYDAREAYIEKYGNIRVGSVDDLLRRLFPMN